MNASSHPARSLAAVRAAQLLITGDPVKRWPLATLARRVNCSRFQLARAFRAAVGTPIHRYQVHARLTAALDPLLRSSRGLSAIALDAGFAHHSHFTAAFRRAFGITPSALRRACREGSPFRRMCP